MATDIILYAKTSVSLCYTYLVRNPFLYTYLYGPRLYIPMGVGSIDVGFWAGLPVHDICTQLIPHSTSDMWTKNERECEYIVLRQVHSYEVGIAFLAYLFIMMALVFQLKYSLLRIPALIARRICRK